MIYRRVYKWQLDVWRHGHCDPVAVHGASEDNLRIDLHVNVCRTRADEPEGCPLSTMPRMFPGTLVRYPANRAQQLDNPATPGGLSSWTMYRREYRIPAKL